MSLQQLRGMEGVRVRESYAKASQDSGVPWHGRSYDRTDWNKADAVNRALSTANVCLYGVCHSAIITAGYSPALGFIHSGNQQSFVYDIADLYKADVSIPAAFKTTALKPDKLETEVRRICRDIFYRYKLLNRIIPDIEELFDFGEGKISDVKVNARKSILDDGDEPSDESPLGYWEPEKNNVEGEE